MSTESRRRYPQAWTSALRTGPGWSRGAAASARGHGVRCEGPDSGQPTQTQEGSNRNANAAGRQDGQHWKTLSGGRGEGRTGLTRRRPEGDTCRYAVSAGAETTRTRGGARRLIRATRRRCRCVVCLPTRGQESRRGGQGWNPNETVGREQRGASVEERTSVEQKA